MKKIIMFFFAFGIFFNCISIAQKSLIQVKVIGSAHNTIKYSNYIHEDYFMPIYTPEGSTIKKIDSSYSIELDQNTEKIFQIQINNQGGAILAISPGDTVSLNFTILKDTINKNNNTLRYKLDITGSNYLAHYIYRDRFNPIAKHRTALDSLCELYDDAQIDDLYKKIIQVINKKTQVWDSLLLNNRISKSIYSLYSQDTKGWMYLFLVKYLMKKRTTLKSSDLANSYDSMVQKIFIEQGGTDKYLLRTYVGSQFYEKYLSLKVRNDISIKDTLLKQIYENYFFLFDSAYREKAWGNTVLSSAINSPYSENSGNKANALVFAKYYPNSIYIKKVQAIYDSVKAVRKKNSTYQQIISKSYTSLKEIFNSNADRFFFIDTWATWCGPCLSEFAYTPQLEKQLDSLQIKKIYLSIDELADSTKWKEVIKKYYLNGSHYLAGKNIQIEIIEKLLKKTESGGLSIPQYFMYDKLRDRYYMFLSRPSSEDILYDEVKKIISESN